MAQPSYLRRSRAPHSCHRALLCLFTAGFLLAGLLHVVPISESAEVVKINVSMEPLGALVEIAHEKGFFEKAGIRAELIRLPSGVSTLETLHSGGIDLAISSHVAYTFHSFSTEDCAIIASIGSSDNDGMILARKDRGIHSPWDLRGKRIATLKGGAVHFFLHLFHIDHRIPEKDVQVMFMREEELLPALVNGMVDAISYREPVTSSAKRALGDNLIIFRAPRLFSKTYTLIATREAIEKKPEAIKRVLRALTMAEVFVKKHPRAAIEIVAKGIKVNKAEMDLVLSAINLKVSLDQALLLSLEDVARWAIRNKLTKEKTVPNYLYRIHSTLLQAVKPEAVTIIQ